MCFRAKIKEILQNCSKTSSLSIIVCLALLQLMLQQQQHVLAGSVAKGLTRTRSSRIARIHELQAVAESLPAHAFKSKDKSKSAAKLAAGKYEIQAVSGEPNYKSVNLTWEVEFVPAASTETMSADTATVTNSSIEVEPPKAFQIFYCEMQSFGPHRCRSKLVDESQELPESEVLQQKQLRHYASQIDNLRMATRYSFHIRPQQKDKKITGRSEIFNNEVEEQNFSNQALTNFGGQTIIIPTKGFSAEATKCLPHASEIEVETGPFFGGKIVVDGGNCGIKGNPDDPLDKYTMRIDHKMCGSMVKPETNTVETFITVQENLGIFTHSTRRFVVVCSFQSGMQTVRASFTVPGKEGVASAVENDPFEPDDRLGRGIRQMRFVDKSSLILKGDTNLSEELDEEPSEESEAALVQEVEDPALSMDNKLENFGDSTDAVAVIEDIMPGVNEEHIKHENELESEAEEKHSEEYSSAEASIPVTHARLAKYAKLVVDQEEPVQDIDDWLEAVLKGEHGAPKTALHHIASNFGSVVLTISLSVIMIGVFVYVVVREARRQTLINANNTRLQQHKQRQLQQKQQKPLPRVLQEKQQLQKQEQQQHQ